MSESSVPARSARQSALGIAFTLADRGRREPHRRGGRGWELSRFHIWRFRPRRSKIRRKSVGGNVGGVPPATTSGVTPWFPKLGWSVLPWPIVASRWGVSHGHILSFRRSRRRNPCSTSRS